MLDSLLIYLLLSKAIPDPDNGDNPTFETGTNTFTLTNEPDNDQNAATTIGEEAYPTSWNIGDRTGSNHVCQKCKN